jgi:transcriptional regulator with PAS, ATPase and Fis domain
LITGETGTGKELVAQALHEAGPRQKHPLVAVNCGSIPETLLESVLFGHAKGAFTGADRDKHGLFEVAKEGTLFLDEIGELPLSLQPKILRALERREVLPVGSTSPVQFAARVVAATNRDLPSMIQKNLFRSDLYYRLNVIEIRIPPLRERPEDIAVIAEFLLNRLCAKMRRSVPQVEPGVLRSFENHSWPGNVREMSNILERLLIMCEEGFIRESDLANVRIAPQTNATDDLKEARGAFEREHIRRVLEKWGGNKERAARALGIDLSSLYRKLST